MKTNEDVIVGWVRGESGKSKHVIATEDVLYSYGEHFPMAVRKDGKTYVNKDGYSMTTAHHQSILARELGYSSNADLRKNYPKELLKNSEEMRELAGGTPHKQAVDMAEMMAKMFYRAGARERFEDLSLEDKRKVGLEIMEYINNGEAIWNVHDKRYTLSMFPGEKFTGLQLYSYVQEISSDLGFDPDPKTGAMAGLVARTKVKGHKRRL